MLEEIIAHHLSELGQKHYGAICRDLGLTLDEVLAAEKVIASLNPYPGREFQAEETVEYIRPDIFIAEIDGELQVILNEYYLPKISISDYYVRLLKSSEEKETLDYLRQKLQQAKWLLNYLEQRGRTLRRCADAILEAQRAFFTGATTELTPQTLVSLSRELQLHPSTVSRAIRGKYLQCRQGTYPLRYFFNRSVEENGPSRQAIKQRLIEIMKREDPSSPYSDQQLCTLLSQRGVNVSRRTVAKYRLELGIASSTARKRIAR